VGGGGIDRRRRRLKGRQGSSTPPMEEGKTEEQPKGNRPAAREQCQRGGSTVIPVVVTSQSKRAQRRPASKDSRPLAEHYTDPRWVMHKGVPLLRRRGGGSGYFNSLLQGDRGLAGHGGPLDAILHDCRKAEKMASASDYENHTRVGEGPSSRRKIQKGSAVVD